MPLRLPKNPLRSSQLGSPSWLSGSQQVVGSASGCPQNSLAISSGSMGTKLPSTTSGKHTGSGLSGSPPGGVTQVLLSSTLRVWVLIMSLSVIRTGSANGTSAFGRPSPGLSRKPSSPVGSPSVPPPGPPGTKFSSTIAKSSNEI